MKFLHYHLVVFLQAAHKFIDSVVHGLFRLGMLTSNQLSAGILPRKWQGAVTTPSGRWCLPEGILSLTLVSIVNGEHESLCGLPCKAVANLVLKSPIVAANPLEVNFMLFAQGKQLFP